MVTPDQAIFPGPDKEMSLSTAYSKGGLAGVLGWIPLYNTVLLLTSSVTVHIAHIGLKNGNRKQFDFDALAHAMTVLSLFADKNRDTIVELDLNPVILFEKGKGLMALDALIVTNIN